MVSVLVIMISGCSLALTGPDPLRASNVAPQCDSSKGLVATDWVLAGIAATIALSALGEDAGELAAASALTSVAFIASAARGNGVVNKCRQEIASYSPPRPEVDDDGEVARRPRTVEDPYDQAAERPARRIVTPRAPAPRPPPATTPPTPPSAPTAAKPASTPAQPTFDDEWADFWTEVP